MLVLVLAKWSACRPSTLKIRVLLRLKSIVLFYRLIEKNKNEFKKSHTMGLVLTTKLYSTRLVDGTELVKFIDSAPKQTSPILGEAKSSAVRQS